MSTVWLNRFSQRAKSAKSSMIRELLKVSQLPGVISFAGGLPAGELFPTEKVAEACQEVLRTKGSTALQYSATEGYAPLRELLAQKLRRYGILADVENILITSGSQQALDLIGKLLINAGDRVLVEAPTYLGALQAFNIYGAEYVSVPIDDDGLRTDLLEHSLRSGPKFMYVLPNFQNPGGTTLSEGRRHELVLIAERYGVPIVEDDPYGQLRYEGEHLPPLVVVDRENLRRDHGYHLGNVIYMSTLSKTLAPGLRLGWIAAPSDVIAKLVQIKQGTDLHTSTFTQMVAYEIDKDGFIDEHVKKMRPVYKERRDAMLKSLQEFFPPECKWTHPQGGLFLWATLPENVDAHHVLKTALEEDVAFVPGDCFYPGNGKSGHRHMRLSFSSTQPDQIREGIQRLSRAVQAHMHVPHGAGTR